MVRAIFTLIVVFVGAAILVGCGQQESEEAESTPSGGLLTAARDAVGEASDSVGGAIGEAAEEAQSVIGSASDTAETTAAQAGDAFEAVSTVVVDQGGEAAEVIVDTGESVSEAIQERFATLKPDEDGNFSVSINESEINQLLKIQELLTGPIPGNPLRNTVIDFREDVIVFTADVYEPLVGQLDVRFNPYIDEGRVRFAVIDASLGEKDAPQATLDAAEETLNRTLGAAIGYLPGGLRPHEISVTSGQLTIFGGNAPEETT
jgi:hypothetical protein